MSCLLVRILDCVGDDFRGRERPDDKSPQEIELNQRNQLQMSMTCGQQSACKLTLSTGVIVWKVLLPCKGLMPFQE